VTACASANGHRAGPPRQTVDWDALGYRPDPAVPLLACRCGAKYLDDYEGCHAHRVVFLHDPKTREPNRPGGSTEGEST
jgi:hypothetical protein